MLLLMCKKLFLWATTFSQRIMFNAVFDCFSLFFSPLLVPMKPKWGPNCADDVPLPVRARVPRTGTSSAQLGPHFGPFSVKPERTGPSKPKNSSQVARTHFCVNFSQSAALAWAWLIQAVWTTWKSNPALGRHSSLSLMASSIGVWPV